MYYIVYTVYIVAVSLLCPVILGSICLINLKFCTVVVVLYISKIVEFGVVGFRGF